ncbi:hypothetical protein GCM10010267_51920 [Streptomyces griseorubens]|nr:hypothetical protein GCM10010267_51920 [Streptomyces griseorubens]
MAWLSVYLMALIGAANDVIATHLHVSVNAVTWAVRIGLFVAPLAAFVIAKRWALGLQHRDRETVLHGRESGVIKRLGNGEYVEVHEPLSQARLHALTAHEQQEPLKALENDGRAPTFTQRLRVKLSRGFYGPGTQVPKPTVDEYKEVTRRHGV